MVKLNIYTKAFFLTLGIFIIGLFIGMNVEKLIGSDLLKRSDDVERSIQEIELEMLYFQTLNASYSCDFLNEIVRETNNNLDDLSDRLSSYSEDNILFWKSDVEDQKKKYTYLLIKDWLLQERIKIDCGTKTVSVLYFYKRKECGDCIIQGNILSILKNSFREKLMVFPLDIDVKLSMIDILIKRFNITSTPSLVIEDNLYQRIVSKEELNDIVCDILPGNITACS